MTEPTRVLVAARLSRLVKGRDQVSIERQDQAAERYAAEHGATTVGPAADAGVSGSVSPFKRPELGPYFRPPLVDTWDEIVAATIDRLGRNARDLAALRDFAEDHGKRITILSPRLTWPPEPDDFASGLIWDVLARLAEIELRLTAKRYADTRAYLTARGSLVGKPGWGFLVVGTKADKTIAPDPARADYLRGMIDRALDGETLDTIADWMDAKAMADPAAAPRHVGRWNPKVISQILRNPSLAGRRQDEHSRTILRHEGVIDAAKFARLQAKLDSNPKRRGPTRNKPALLTDTLYCQICGGIMHARRTRGRARKDGTRPLWVGYRCDRTRRVAEDGTVTLDRKSTCRNMIPGHEIERWVDDHFSDPALFGDLEVIERTFVPPRGHAAEVAEVEADIRDLAADLDRPDWADRMAKLRAERARLLALADEPAHWEDRKTGETVAQRWRHLTTAQKRDYLIRSQTTVYAASIERLAEIALAAEPGREPEVAWIIDVAEPNVLRVA